MFPTFILIVGFNIIIFFHFVLLYIFNSISFQFGCSELYDRQMNIDRSNNLVLIKYGIDYKVRVDSWLYMIFVMT